MEQKTQDIYNADVLSEILGKTVITRTFEEVCGKNIKQLHQVPVLFPPEEKEVYEKAMDEFLVMRNDYFNLTGNSRKDSMMKLIQQIVLLLRISAAPDTVKEYGGDTPVKVMAAVELAAGWENEIVAIGEMCIRDSASIIRDGSIHWKKISSYIPRKRWLRRITLL